MRCWFVLFLALSLSACQKEKPHVSRQEKEEKLSVDLPENMPIGQRQMKALRDAKQLKKDLDNRARDQQQELDQDQQAAPEQSKDLQ